MSVYDSAAAQYESIRTMIVGGELPPGAVLLETALAKKLGVSRTPVREALARLAQEELINREIRGYVVKTRTPEEIREIYDVRIILESACAAAAAEQASRRDLASLERITAEAEHCTDHEKHVELNTEWHHALRAAARNGTMSRLLDGLGVLQQIYNAQMTQVEDLDEVLRAGQEEHVLILDALRRGDAETARTTMIRHLSRTRDLKVDAFQRNHSAIRC
ncbi:GntR family transcriptional regulator [Streptomyces sp. NBS 14/10]|uniref:GntR family transcriptional regulator n=1 Tax=Streptomyces sp. NBS 14/10 TaxID=1945643 RepID=UPI000B7F5417|nr:GntR family transcriptional regulator [Streptomyces sp. NBS 14/10]KAK1177177.1 GntR family transcriptional regulator [Streptomyces sp. NBS 14/10]